METSTLEDRVDRLEQLLDRLIDYARSSRAGRVVLEKLGLSDA